MILIENNVFNSHRYYSNIPRNSIGIFHYFCAAPKVKLLFAPITRNWVLSRHKND